MTTTREGVSALDLWTRWALPHTPENLVESAELLGLIKQQTNQVKDKRTQQSGKPTLPPRDPDGKFLKFCELTRSSCFQHQFVWLPFSRTLVCKGGQLFVLSCTWEHEIRVFEPELRCCVTLA